MTTTSYLQKSAVSPSAAAAAAAPAWNGDGGRRGGDGDESNLGEDGEEEEGDRGHWSGKLDFLLSCLGYAVGKGERIQRNYLWSKFLRSFKK